MSLTDKVIKNTFYHFLSQAFGFLSPFILTPLIIAYIGVTEFGMYAIVMGFIGTFALFDFSISASFIKFISEHYNKNQFENLNKTINTGLFFYIGFTTIICIIVIFFSTFIFNLINIPPNLYSLAVFSLNISLIIFFLATSSTIFVSVLISIQKMYLNSMIGLIINILNFFSTYLLLTMGYGLKGVLYSQLIAVIVSVFFNIYLSFKEIPQLKIGFRYLDKLSFKSMSKLGLQMQVSRFSVFLSEKYDEFLLGHFSSLSNVTYFNLANRVTRFGRFFPLQLFQQVAPVAAELNAKDQNHKLTLLFTEATKYLTVFSLPIFIYIIFFADLIMTTWVGSGYDTSVYLLRILAAGQIVNLLLSAPGNSIIPNLGLPKYLMYEGLISLAINLILSFLLIKYYGIVGAAIGTSVSTASASIYVYITSVKYFKENIFPFLIKSYLLPLMICTAGCLITFIIFYEVRELNLFKPGRLNSILMMIFTSGFMVLLYITALFKTKYINQKDKDNLSRLIKIIKPFNKTLS